MYTHTADGGTNVGKYIYFSNYTRLPSNIPSAAHVERCRGVDRQPFEIRF